MGQSKSKQREGREQLKRRARAGELGDEPPTTISPVGGRSRGSASTYRPRSRSVDLSQVQFVFPFLELPVDLQSVVLSFLDAGTLCAVRLCSKHTCEIATSDSLWELMLRRDFPEYRFADAGGAEHAAEVALAKENPVFSGSTPLLFRLYAHLASNNVLVYDRWFIWKRRGFVEIVNFDNRAGVTLLLDLGSPVMRLSTMVGSWIFTPKGRSSRLPHPREAPFTQDSKVYDAVWSEILSAGLGPSGKRRSVLAAPPSSDVLSPAVLAQVRNAVAIAEQVGPDGTSPPIRLGQWTLQVLRNPTRGIVLRVMHPMCDLVIDCIAASNGWVDAYIGDPSLPASYKNVIYSAENCDRFT